MAQILKPSDLSLIWASAGDSLDPGPTKYASGWGVEIPPLQTFNYLDSRQDQAIAHINQHGVPVWDSNTEYQEDKSYVQGVTNGTIYRCVQTHTNQDPETDVSNTYWIIAFASAGDFYTKTEANNLYLAKASNGSDIPNAATFRSNIDVYQTTQVYTKTEVDAKTTVASTAQAQAGTSNITLMTPLRTEEWGNANVLGMGQTWQDVTGSRVLGVNYTNTTGRAICVVVASTTTLNQTAVSITVDGIVVSSISVDQDAGGGFLSSSAIVPAGSVYSATVAPGLNYWRELR
tara:strand:- start:52370 stop:53236 length:867 start_codon:yes stop_codon:yes gene_type:complete